LKVLKLGKNPKLKREIESCEECKPRQIERKEDDKRN
jgi:hypothetical protein